MKLLHAEFHNFRLLRDLELNFSCDPNRNLTVVRAANESGKTTILHALQWALYGEDALPDKGVGFRLHPVDWDVRDGKHVVITATIEFEVTKYRPVAGRVRETRRRYRLVRSTFEYVDSQERRPGSTVKLFELTNTGANPIPAPESLINDELPPDLREVFFTDGDRALSFIEANVTRSTKRDRVQRAIRSLLGLGVIGDAIKHVRKSAAEVNKKAKQIGGGGELNKIASRLETIENTCNNLEEGLEDAKVQFAAFDERVEDIDRKIALALQKGDKETLRRDLDKTNQRIKRLDDQLAAAKKEHSALYRRRSITTDLLAPLLGSALGKLDEMHDRGQIPNTTIPVLQERLAAELCICGETLGAGDARADIRRTHIQQLIEDSRRADRIQEIVTQLYFGAKQLHPSGTIATGAWLRDYKRVANRHDTIQDLRDEAGRTIRALELQVDSLPDIDIRGLRETQRRYKSQRDRYLSKQSVIETQLSGLRRERTQRKRERNRLLREKTKGVRVLTELDVIQDVTTVLRNAYDRITNEELKKVSDLMNIIFLEMIGADPEQGAIIRRAEINSAFDIIVYGPKDRTLNPDRDLNGASRRALTLAFILALTKVSEVEAPNVIDTPLGMTSGYVKRSILRTAVRESAQIVLFLTHDEVAGCDEILDEKAGVVFTLTNPAHYPIMLINNPRVVQRKILRCECDHRSECNLCARRTNAYADVTLES